MVIRNNVTINSDSLDQDEVTVEVDTVYTIDKLSTYGNILLEWWGGGYAELTLADPCGLTNYGTLDLAELDINGNVFNVAGVGAELLLEGAEIFGTLYNGTGAVIEAESENDVMGDIQNDGMIGIYHASDLLCESNVYNSGLINLYGGEFGVSGLINNNSAGVMRGFGILSAQTLNNQGNLYAYGSSLAVSCQTQLVNTGSLSNFPMSSLNIRAAQDPNNLETITANTGGGVAFDNDLTNMPGGTIQLHGGTLAVNNIIQKAGATFQGFGSIASNVEIEDNGLIEITGQSNVIGNMVIGANATLEISDGTTLVTGHTTNNGTIHMKGGRLIPQGGLTNNGNVIWEPGLYNNIADFNLDGQVNLSDMAEFAKTRLWQSQL